MSATPTFSSPEMPAFAPDVLNRAMELLPDHTRETLDIDRTRQLEETAVAVVALTAELGLVEPHATEFQRAMLERVGLLPNDHIEYVATTLGAIVAALVEQPDIPQRDRSISADEGLNDNDTEDSSSRPVLDAEDNTPNKAVVSDQHITYNDITLNRHPKPLHRIRRFLAKLSPDTDTTELSSEELSIVALQIVATYKRHNFPNERTSKKATLAERLEKHFALYDAATPTRDICKELGISDPAYYTSINTIIDRLQTVINADSLIEFIDIARSALDLAPNSAGVPSQDTLPAVRHEQSLRQYDKAPANMTNFLVDIYPPRYDDRIHALSPRQASQLTYYFIREAQQLLRQGGTSADLIAERCRMLEYYTGIYAEPLLPVDIARRRATTTNRVTKSLESCVRQIRDGLEASLPGLLEHIEST